jgi:hypothetical protein
VNSTENTIYFKDFQVTGAKGIFSVAENETTVDGVTKAYPTIKPIKAGTDNVTFYMVNPNSKVPAEKTTGRKVTVSIKVVAEAGSPDSGSGTNKGKGVQFTSANPAPRGAVTVFENGDRFTYTKAELTARGYANLNEAKYNYAGSNNLNNPQNARSPFFLNRNAKFTPAWKVDGRNKEALNWAIDGLYYIDEYGDVVLAEKGNPDSRITLDAKTGVVTAVDPMDLYTQIERYGHEVFYRITGTHPHYNPDKEYDASHGPLAVSYYLKAVDPVTKFTLPTGYRNMTLITGDEFYGFSEEKVEWGEYDEQKGIHPFVKLYENNRMRADSFEGYFYDAKARHTPTTNDILITITNPKVSGSAVPVLLQDKETGVITANMPGKATVKVTTLSGNKSASVTVNVKDAPVGIDLSTNYAVVARNKSLTLKATAQAAPGRLPAEAHIGVVWQLSEGTPFDLARNFTLNAKTGALKVGAKANIGDTVWVDAYVPHPLRTDALHDTFWELVNPGAGILNKAEKARVEQFYFNGVGNNAQIEAGTPEVAKAVMFLRSDILNLADVGEADIIKTKNVAGVAGEGHAQSVSEVSLEAGSFYKLEPAVLTADGKYVRNQDIIWTTNDKKGESIIVYPDGEIYVKYGATKSFTVTAKAKHDGKTQTLKINPK